MVAYAYAAIYPDKVERLVVMDAPISGIEPWSEILQNPGVWHFNFHGPDAERLAAKKLLVASSGLLGSAVKSFHGRP
jgi:pimeloyl-ACP methyl ester carboxylesterase